MRKTGKRGLRETPTIGQIRVYEWAGNHAEDSAKMEAIDSYVAAAVKAGDTAGAKEALTIMSRDGMGEDGECDDAGLAEYLAERP